MSDSQSAATTKKVNTILVPNSGTQKINVNVGSQVLSFDPSVVKVDGTTYSAGGLALTLSDSVFTLAPEANPGRSGVSVDDHDLHESSLFASDAGTIDGQTIVLNPSETVFAGSSPLPGGNPLTLSNIPTSPAPSGILVIGSPSNPLPPQPLFTIASQTFAANPTGFVIAGTSLIPSGSAVTISGTPISLASGGTLDIDISTIVLPSQSIFQVAGQTFTAQPTGFTINSVKISPGCSAQTVDGTVISLGQSGSVWSSGHRK